MTIQLPVLLWTIILFIVLMLVLKNLLFKPFFRVMDARKARVEAARAAHASDMAKLEELKLEAEEAERKQLEERRRLAAERDARVGGLAGQRLEAARSAQHEQIRAYAAQLEQEKASMLAQIGLGLDSIAEKTAVRLTQSEGK